jgi:phthiocerol/phenolphthiocerol synthesis type-I polyketide synthase E
MTQPAVDDGFGKIAVIGMSGRYPKAGNLAEFWKNLVEGRECISFYSNEELLEAGLPRELVEDPHFVRALGAYDGTFLFDAPLFGYMPREAELLDPQHRVLMECAWDSLEHAGYDPWRYSGRIGMFAGSGATQYYSSSLPCLNIGMPPIDLHCSPTMIATFSPPKLPTS